MSVWRLAWRVSQHEARTFWAGTGLFVLFFTMPVVVGVVLSRAFEALSDGNSSAVLRWTAVYIVAEIARMAALHGGVMIWTRVWLQMQTLLRANMLAAQVASGGSEAGAPVASAGEAVTHFRDDTEDVAQLVDGLVDVSAGLVFTAIAGSIMVATDANAALILIVPLAVVVVITRVLDDRIKRYRHDDRLATSAVTQLVGDTMAAATTVKVNGAVEPVLGRLRERVDRRGHTAVKDRVLDEGVYAFSQGATDVGLGLVLLVSAGALAAGTFDVGALALFVAYLGWLNFLPRMLGRVLARRKQAGVAVDRMRELVHARAAANTVRARSLPIGTSQRRVRPDVRPPTRRPLERLEVVDLSASHGAGGGVGGVGEVTFHVARGELVVLTGEVGSGKTTLLRALLGLEPPFDVTGEIRWNGEVIHDRAAFFVPPNAAFLPQVPQLLSDSLTDNIGFGAVGVTDVERAIELAVMAGDVAQMPEGLTTLVGPRGLRLSGGQRQRLAGARAVVHRPELVVLDDLSSALDVETELRLWDNLAAAGMTVLAVSHRTVAFERADRVLTLEDGRLVGRPPATLS